MKTEHWTLLAIAWGEKPRTPVELHKGLYIFNREALDDEAFDFEPRDCGPACPAITSHVEMFDVSDLIWDVSDDWSSRYTPSKRGIDKAESLERKIREASDEHNLDYLQTVVEWVERQGFKELLRKIADKYPESMSESIFRDAPSSS